jgi:hypothetical protein
VKTERARRQRARENRRTVISNTLLADRPKPLFLDLAFYP